MNLCIILITISNNHRIECLKVLFYRDCRASSRIQIAKATTDGLVVSEPYELATSWETATFDARHVTRAADGSSW
jgi:20S proteasome subunit beta 7